MPDPISQRPRPSANARAVFTFSPRPHLPRRVPQRVLYFLRIGGQFDTDRLALPAGGGLLPAVIKFRLGWGYVAFALPESND
jgi:hypothetical protein